MSHTHNLRPGIIPLSTSNTRAHAFGYSSFGSHNLAVKAGSDTRVSSITRDCSPSHIPGIVIVTDNPVLTLHHVTRV